MFARLGVLVGVVIISLVVDLGILRAIKRHHGPVVRVYTRAGGSRLLSKKERFFSVWILRI